MGNASYSGTISNSGYYTLALPDSPSCAVYFDATFTTTLGGESIGAVGTVFTLAFYNDQPGQGDTLAITLSSENTPGAPGCGTFTGNIQGWPPTYPASSGGTLFTQVHPDSAFVPGFTYTWTVSGFFNATRYLAGNGSSGPCVIYVDGSLAAAWDTYTSAGGGGIGSRIDAGAPGSTNSFGSIVLSTVQSIFTVYEINVTTAQAGTEVLVLNVPSPSAYKSIVLTGGNFGTAATAMDYQRDQNGTWTALSAFKNPGGVFSGTTQDKAAYDGVVHSYQVRDSNNPTLTSNIVYYELENPATPGNGTLTVMFPMPVYLECVPCAPVLLAGGNNLALSAGAD